MRDKETNYDIIIDILNDIFGDHRKHNDYRGQISYDCPVCSQEIKGLDEGDGKGNLEINYFKEAYKCWACYESHDTHGSLYKLIKIYGSKNDLRKFLLYRPESDEDRPKVNYEKVKLPKEYVEFTKATIGQKMIPQYKQAYSYLKKRNISEDVIEKLKIGFCYEGYYENRIIIPSFNKNGTLNYFIARSFIPNDKLKYRNPTAQKDTIIWNEHLIKWDQPIYLVEGVFDSLFLENSIPMLGKFLSDHLFEKIYENATSTITIVLDPDAWEDAERLYHKINCGRLWGRVYIIQLKGDKDIADLAGQINNLEVKQLI